jgi:hypothetical protein
MKGQGVGPGYSWTWGTCNGNRIRPYAPTSQGQVTCSGIPPRLNAKLNLNYLPCREGKGTSSSGSCRNSAVRVVRYIFIPPALFCGTGWVLEKYDLNGQIVADVSADGAIGRH